MEERLQKQLDFIREIDKIKNIFRQTYIGDGSRPENDAEHSWHLALMAMFLQEYANEEVDILHVIKLVLIHDLVEIDAGDTYAYDPEANKTKREREVAAAERIFNILPADQAKELRALWEEYEAEETPEAKFGLALDILHPVMENEMSDGIAWVNHNVVEDAPRERIERMRMGSEALYQVAKDIVDRAVAAGHIIPSDKYSEK